MLMAAALLPSACSETIEDRPKENQPPESYLSLFPDDELRTTTSRQHIHWWGDDPDGFVAGYFFSFDNSSWKFTSSNDSVFSLSLSGSDTTYSFFVRAVDNQGNHVYDHDGPYGPEPYHDLNGNGAYDKGEPFTDLGLWDPTPASLDYPIRNTPPVVEFAQGSEMPDTSFTVATFSWLGSDLDGDHTILEYRYALNDTIDPASWVSVSRGTIFLTLFESDGIREGNNVFYLKAIDIAGAESRVISMPDSSGTWYAKKPKTELLIVDDYGPADASAEFYNSVTDTLFGGIFRGADIYDIKTGASSTSKGIYLPPYINPTFTETLKLFRYVIWYTDNSPSLGVAELSLTPYRAAGGYVLFTASFPESAVDPRGGITDFAPVDSIGAESIRFVPMGTKAIPDEESPGYPVIVRDNQGVPVAFIRELYKKINAKNMYRFEASSRWEGEPVVAVRSGGSRMILFGIPLHRFNGDGNIGTLIHQIFYNEFGVR